MSTSKSEAAGAVRWAVTGMLAALAVVPAAAQVTAPSPSGAPGSIAAGGAPLGSTVASDPNPYSLGVSQGFTHESNAARGGGGSSNSGDTVSSTTLFGGFNQPIGRQRVFGRADVGQNRYFSNSNLNNTSYNVSGGVDLATVGDLTGGVTAAANRNRAEPSVFTPFGTTAPTTNRNLVSTQSVDARAAWGGSSLLSIDGSIGHSKVDYSSPVYLTSNMAQDRAGIAFHSNPGGSLRLGVGLRESRTKTPQAVPLSATGPFEPNTTTTRNIDLLADYRLSGIVSANGRLSQTRQTNSNASLVSANFSGITGSLSVNYQASGKTSFSGSISRDVGFNSSLLNTYSYTQVGLVTVVSPLTGLYQSNQLTNAVGLDMHYLATGKITANTGVRYARSTTLSSIAGAGTATQLPQTTDTSKLVYISGNWAIERNWSLSCNASHEWRNVSGGVAFDYTNDSIGCAGQYTWP